jgi:hypothetical protein
MTTPPPDRPGPVEPDPTSWAPPDPPEPVSLSKDSGSGPGAEQPSFDPYRFGAPEHPVPPEYAPPGYTPPPPTKAPPPVTHGGYAAYPGTQPPGAPFPGSPFPGAPVPPWQHGYPQPRTGNGKAIAALVFGIAAVLLCWLSIFDVVPVVLAVVFGILGNHEATRRADNRGKGMAVTGIVLAVVGALLATLLTVVLYNRIKPCLDDYQQGSTQYTNCIHDRL